VPRYDVPLTELEAQARVEAEDRAESQASTRPHEPLVVPLVHPFGDGATGSDGDGD